MWFQEKMLMCALRFVHWSFFSLKHHKGVFLLTCVIRMQHTKPTQFFFRIKNSKTAVSKMRKTYLDKILCHLPLTFETKVSRQAAFQGCSCLAENKCLVMQWLFLDCVSLAICFKCASLHIIVGAFSATGFSSALSLYVAIHSVNLVK